jgi:hypothetical protein
VGIIVLIIVVKHEALAVRRVRQSSLPGEEVDFDARSPADQRSVEDRFESVERVARSAEIMRRLKRDEARALMLKAEGLSYVEIAERLEWTYTKVNRCITEGRRRFMKLYAELETGAECERLAPVLHALAQGTATSEALLELRPHLRNCTACRATIRALHASRLKRLSALVPIPALVPPVRGWVERLQGERSSDLPPEPGELRPLERQQELEELFRRLDATQPAIPAAAEHAARLAHLRLNLRAHFEAALQRLSSSDLAMGVHAASASGGGRAASVAALIGVCISGVGAGTYCVATLVLPDPKPIVRAESKAAKRAQPRSNATLTRLPAPASQAVEPTPRRERKTTAGGSNRGGYGSRGSGPRSHEQPPISPASTNTQDFSFEQSTPSRPTQPARAPVTGGGEFEP